MNPTASFAAVESWTNETSARELANEGIVEGYRAMLTILHKLESRQFVRVDFSFLGLPVV